MVTRKKKTGSKKGVSALAKSMAFAKAYQKAHPGASWKTCQKEGGKEYRRRYPKK